MVLLALRSATYYWALYKRQAKPHLFTWINWGLCTAIAAFAQFKVGGGYSAIFLAVVAGNCFLIGALAIFIGEKNITRSDWITFVLALLAIVLWQLTSNPVAALLTVILIDVLAYYPTFRKSWQKPWDEPVVSYSLAFLHYLLSALAVPAYTLNTLLYPTFLAMLELGFVLYLLWRRAVIKTATPKV